MEGKRCFNISKPSGVNIRVCYSTYYSITVVFSLKERALKRYKDTIVYFNKKYAKPENFSGSLGGGLARVRKSAMSATMVNFILLHKLGGFFYERQREFV